MPKNTTPDSDQTAEDAAATAAIAEVDAENTDDGLVQVTHAGVDFSFKRKRLQAVQFLRLMQQRRDAVALDWLLGEPVMDRLLAAVADEDGCTSPEKYTEILKAIGEAVGSGNS